MNGNLLSRRNIAATVRQALREDIGRGDITSQVTLPATLRVTAAVIAVSPGTVAGLKVLRAVFRQQSRRIHVRLLVKGGTRVKPGQRLALVTGPAQAVFAAERTALNFLNHLSGVATLTARYVAAVRATRAVITATRKTLPGLRRLEKYAVSVGGGQAHRMGLYDAVLIKTNHLRAAGGGAVTLSRLIRRTQHRTHKPIEVEVTTHAELVVALACRPHRILLDNVSTPFMRQAVALRNRLAPRTLLEASGGVTLRNVRAIARTGVDRIAVGSLTHSAPSLDCSLRVIHGSL